MRQLTVRVLLLSVSLHCMRAVIADEPFGELIGKFQSPTPTSGSGFGESVGLLDNSYVVIGSPSAPNISSGGRVYAFRTSGELVQTFVNPSTTGGGSFGSSLAALTGEQFVVGARLNGPGQAFIYDLSSAAPVRTLNPPPLAGTSDEFGTSVAGVGDHAVLVGAYRNDARGFDAGASYLFDASTGLHTRTFLNPNPQIEDHFGFSVAGLDQDRVLIGSPLDNSLAVDSGEVFLFNAETGILQRSFLNPQPDAADWFGISVAAAGPGRVLIGASGDDTAASNAGAAYLFDAMTGTLLRTFLNPQPAADDRFGSRVVDLPGELLAIGDAEDDGGAINAGAVYIFDENSGNLVYQFPNPEPGPFDLYGLGLAASSELLLIGAPLDQAGQVSAAGGAYLYAIPEPQTMILLFAGIGVYFVGRRVFPHSWL